MNLKLLEKLIFLNTYKLNLVFFGIVVIGIIGINSGLFAVYDAQVFGPKHNVEKIDVMLIGFIFSLIHVVLTILTLSLIKKMQHANLLIKKERDNIARIDKAKDEFAAMVAHELRTPIVPILSYTKMLHQEIFGQLNDVQKQKLRIILSGAESLSLLIQDLLDLHKSELGQLKLEFAFADVKQMVEEAITITHPLADKRGVVIQDCITKSIKIDMDRKRMVQVLTNLIKNAIDFVSKETGIIKIQLNIESHYVILSVSDNGCGIPKEKIANLFKKFYQIDNSQTRERSGSGLGLVICKTIVDQHTGKMWAESEIGKGTTVKISLPLTTRKLDNLSNTNSNDVRLVLS